MNEVIALRTATLIVALGLPCGAEAHARVVRDAWQWNLEPWLVVVLLASALLYGAGVRKLWRHAGAGRGIRRREVAAFGVGWLTLTIALVSPLDAMGARLFSAHMVQHELLMVVAAPLLVLGRPLATWTWAWSPAQRRALGRAVQWPPWRALWSALTDPLLAWALHALALWAWHIPVLFDAALRSEGLHIAQHASFLASALFFWWAVLGHDARGRYGAGHSVLSLFTTMMHTTALGALLTLAPAAWYAGYSVTAPALGLSAVEDQQLGGLVMWVPAGLAYVIAALAIIGRMLVRARA